MPFVNPSLLSGPRSASSLLRALFQSSLAALPSVSLRMVAFVNHHKGELPYLKFARCPDVPSKKRLLSQRRRGTAPYLVMDFADVHPNPWPTPGHAGQPAPGALGVEASTPGAYIAGRPFATSNDLLYHEFSVMRFALWSTCGVIGESSLDPCTRMIV